MNLINFIKKHQVIYSLGYGVTTLTYFGRYVHGLQDDLLAQAALFVLSMFIGISSWFYVAARIINAWCN